MGQKKILVLLATAALLFFGQSRQEVNGNSTTLKAYFQPFADGRSAVLAELSKATKSVHVAQYNIRDKAYADKLLELKQRGVEVKIVIDEKNSLKPWNTLDDTMIASGLWVMRKSHSSSNYGIMHHKFTIIDDKVVLTGSFNWNSTARLSNNENMLIIEDARLARDYEHEFQELIGQRNTTTGSPSNLSSSDRYQVFFSPEDRPDYEIEKLINNAKSSIHVAMFTFKDSRLSRALVRASNRGVKVELLTEAKQASRTNEDERVANAGGKVVVGANTSSPNSAMHHKYAVIDEAIVLTGACNWTYTAFHYSEEDVLVVRDAALAKSYLNDFADLMKRYDGAYTEADYSYADQSADFNFVCEQPKTKWGETVCVIGNHPALGSWNPKNAVRLDTSSSVFPRWNGYVSLPAGVTVEYKYIRLKADGSVIWESGFNRTLTTSSKGRNETRIEVFRN
ncbi:MAG: phospholipase D-like domain-containing protein [Planctomycetota bacterium]|nr:phospholipase D-like domain-containing protein [Planctomycetota bacterium]